MYPNILYYLQILVLVYIIQSQNGQIVLSLDFRLAQFHYGIYFICMSSVLSPKWAIKRGAFKGWIPKRKDIEYLNTFYVSVCTATNLGILLDAIMLEKKEKGSLSDPYGWL